MARPDPALRALEARLARTRSRGERKALSAALEADSVLRAAAVRLLERRGLRAEGDGRELCRLLLDREEEARRPGNPTRRDAGFECLHCGALVPPGGARVRDHCPWCLRGRHVDEVPGDRSADCGGLLDVEGFSTGGRAGVLVHHRCRRCGRRSRVRAHPEDRLPARLPGEIAVPEAWRPEDEGEVLGSGPAAVPDPAWARARALPLRVLEAVRRGGLWAPGQRVVLAVSGGADSTVLLHALHRTRAAHGGRLEVCSIDHGLRPESVAEVAAVGRQASALNLAFHAISLDVSPGPGLQVRARAARRAALLGLGADRIATGHQQDDQAETVLFHLLCGAGAQGLSGMRALDPPWCRPLLGEPRAVVRAWARLEGLSWTEDPSNDASQRGLLRRLLPALDAVHGGAVEALARSARLLGRDDAALNALARAVLPRIATADGVSLAGLQAEDPAIQLRLLRHLCAEAGLHPRADQLEAALGWRPAEGAELPLPGGAALACTGGVLRVRRG